MAIALLIACVLLIGTAALVVLEGRIIFQLLQQQGRLLLRLEAVEAQLATRGTVMQQDREVAQLSQVLNTPGAVLVRSDGTIGSPLAQGTEAIRTLVADAVGLPTLQSHPMGASVNSNGTGASSLQNQHADPIVGVRMRTVREALQWGSIALKQVGHFDPQLDAQLLLAHALGVERKTLDANIELHPAQEQRFLQLLERIRQGEPIAYLIGHTEFYGLDFLVDNRVLIPRPVTARLVEAALSAVRHMLHAGRTPLVADIGTGSGVIAITLAMEEPRLPYLYATDLSSDALEVAHLNCQRHGVEQRIHLLHGDLAAPLPEPVDIVVANLPYLRTNELDMVTPAVRAHEPHLAFFGGPNGLELLQRFFVEARQSSVLKNKAVLLLEINHEQREPLTTLIHEIWPQAMVSFGKDYMSVDPVFQVYL